MHPSADGDHRRSAAWLAASLGATGLTMLAIGVAFWRFLGVFALSGDDFGLVLHSAPKYVGAAQMLEWFTKGYLGYWDNYPGWAPVGTAFVRPLLNLMLYLEGLAAPWLGDRAYLIADYLAVFVTAGLVVVLLHRYTKIGPFAAATLAVAVGLSPIWYLSLLFPTMGTTALPLCLGALVVLDPGRRDRSWQRTFLAAVLLTLAVAVHETSLVAVGVGLVLLYGYAPAKPRSVEALWLGLPVAFFGLERIILMAARGQAGSIGPSTIYAFNLSPETLPILAKHFLTGPLVPYDSMRFLYARMSGLSGWQIAVWTLAVFANLVVFAAIVSGLRSATETRRKMSLVVALAMALFFPFLMNTDPRVMGLSFALALIAAIALNPERRWLHVMVTITVLAANAGLFILILGTDIPGHIRASEFSTAYQNYLSASIAQYGRKHVVLVNDPVGATGARAMLQMAAWPRTDLDFIVLNSYDGACYAENTEMRAVPSVDGAQAFALTVSGDRLHVSTHFGERQFLLFGGNAPNYRLPTSGFRYAGAPPTGLGGATLDASGTVISGETLVIGIDPRTGSFLSPLLP